MYLFNKQISLPILGLVKGVLFGLLLFTTFASVGAPQANQLFPIGFQCSEPNCLDLTPGDAVSFGSKFVGGIAPSNWQWVNFISGGGDAVLSDAITNGSAVTLGIGSIILEKAVQSTVSHYCTEF